MGLTNWKFYEAGFGKCKNQDQESLVTKSNVPCKKKKKIVYNDLHKLPMFFHLPVQCNRKKDICLQLGNLKTFKADLKK